jgi:hypothetical protein
VNSKEWVEELRPWVRAEHRPAFESAWAWLGPRCRTEEERRLAPALLLLLSPLNALVTPCRPAAGSCVNFQVTLSRQGMAGPERVRLVVRTRSGVQAFRRSGVRNDWSDPSELSDPSDPSDTSAPAPERPNASTPEHPTLWLDAGAIADDPLAGAVRVLAALLESGSES